MTSAVGWGPLFVAGPRPATTLAQQSSSAPSATLPSTVPTGTRFLVRLDDEVSTQKHHVNKKFKAKTLEPLQTADGAVLAPGAEIRGDRKSTRLNSSHLVISYAVFCLKKKKKKQQRT